MPVKSAAKKTTPRVSTDRKTTSADTDTRWKLPKGHKFVASVMIGDHAIRTTSHTDALGYKKRMHTVYAPGDKGRKLGEYPTKALAVEAAKHHDKMAQLKESLKGSAVSYTPIKKPITPKMVGSRIMSTKFRNYNLIIMGTGMLVAEPKDLPAAVRNKIQPLQNQSETSLARQITQFVVTKDKGTSVTPHTYIGDIHDSTILVNESGNPTMAVNGRFLAWFLKKDPAATFIASKSGVSRLTAVDNEGNTMGVVAGIQMTKPQMRAAVKGK